MFLALKNKLYNEDIIDLQNATLFAKGGNRACYIYPANPDLCLKIVRDSSIKRLRAKRSFIKNIRPGWWFDDNKNEYRAYQQSAIKNNPDIYSHIPKCYGWVNTSAGRGLVLDYYKQASGEPCITLQTYLEKHGYTSEIKEKLESLAQYFRETKLLTKNILSHNIIITEDGILKIIDGLGASSRWSPANFFSLARNYYIERRIRRMFLRMEWESGERSKTWLETEKDSKL